MWGELLQVDADGLVLQVPDGLRGRARQRRAVDGGLGAVVVLGRQELHLDDLERPGVGARRVDVRDLDAAEERERHGAVVLEELRRHGRPQRELQAAAVAEREGRRPREDEQPDAQELRRRARQPREVRGAPELLVGVGRRHDERAALERRPPVRLDVHVVGRARRHGRPEVLVEARAQELEVVLEGHVEPDGLVLEPARRERHHAAHLEGLALERLADLVLADGLVVEGRREHGVVDLLQLDAVGPRHGLELAHGPLEEEREDLGLEGRRAHERLADEVLQAGVLVRRDDVLEVRGHDDPVRVGERLLDAPLQLLRGPAEEVRQRRGVERDLVAREEEAHAARYASRYEATRSQYSKSVSDASFSASVVLAIKSPSSTGTTTGRCTLRIVDASQSPMRQASQVSGMPDPSRPGRPFMASFQPGLFASISTPRPLGSSSVNLVAKSRSTLETGSTV